MRRLREGRENAKDFGFEFDGDGTRQQADEGDQRQPLLILTHCHTTAFILRSRFKHQHTQVHLCSSVIFVTKIKTRTRIIGGRFQRTRTRIIVIQKTKTKKKLKF